MNLKNSLSLFTAAPQGLIWQSTLATASALLWLLAVPPFDFGWVAWFAFVPLLYALSEDVSLPRAFWLGWLTGLLFTFFAENWIAYSMITYGGMSSFLAYGIAFVFAALLALFPALFALGVSWCLKRFGAWALALAPCFWVASEFIRPMITGITWNALGITQVNHFAVARLSQYGGVSMLSALVIAANALLLLITKMNLPRVRLAASGLLMFGAIAFWVPALQQPGTRGGVEVNVLGVQPNIPVDIQINDTTRYLLKTVALTRGGIQKNAQAAKPDLVVWAECPMTLFYENEPDTQARLTQLTQETGAHFIVNTAARNERNEYFNSVTTITPDGKAMKRYDKMRLLPFGEYVPWRAVLGHVVPAMIGDFTPGREAVVNTLRMETTRQDIVNSTNTAIERTTNFVKTGTFICYEAAFPAEVRNFVQRGATLLVNISEDAWFGPTAGAEQHLHHALMRAIETDRDVVRVTNTGISALLTADGRVVEALPQFTEGSQLWQARTRSAQTFYTRHGEWFAWLCLALSGCCLALAAFRKSASGKIDN